MALTAITVLVLRPVVIRAYRWTRRMAVSQSRRVWLTIKRWHCAKFHVDHRCYPLNCMTGLPTGDWHCKICKPCYEVPVRNRFGWRCPNWKERDISESDYKRITRSLSAQCPHYVLIWD